MTHRKIAKLAHVSVSTVSKALSGSREVSSEVAEKIIKIAANEGYFREKSKRRLDYLKEKNPIIAVICPEIESIFYSDIVTSLKEEFESRGGMVAVYISDFSVDKASQIIETLIRRNSADAIISISKAVVNIKPNLPIVFFESDETTETIDTIGADTDAMIDDAIKYLKDSGHEKIGFAGEKNTMGKFNAFKKAMKNHNLYADNKFIYNTDKRFEEIGYYAVEKMLKENELPTAILTAYDEIALAIIHKLRENGINVPSDISVVGINDIPQASYSAVPLTTIKIMYSEQCKRIADIIYKKIYGETSSSTHINVSHKLIIRESTSKLSKI